ncbi:YHS domain-containing protein [Prosthecobacter fluviatilis]|uniref:YHS domain-containing protein n=1 Tax=Prosthecobacter fluviatilis TaxID=445931 RepID=A0ABW0KVY7_9BACT
MKTNTLILLAALLLSLGLVSCASTSATTGGTKPYPLKVCLVTGNDLDSMGGPVSTVYNGQEIKFCCKPCLRKFEANPAKYLSKL